MLLSCGCPPIRNPSSKFGDPSSFVHVFVFVFSVFFVIYLRPTALGLAHMITSEMRARCASENSKARCGEARARLPLSVQNGCIAPCTVAVAGICTTLAAWRYAIVWRYAKVVQEVRYCSSGFSSVKFKYTLRRPYLKVYFKVLRAVHTSPQRDQLTTVLVPRQSRVGARYVIRY